jgi:PAS domain S-box-containing protein
MKMTRRILVVEDELVVAADIQQRLVALGYDVPVIASSGAEAVQQAMETKPDLVLMDIVLQGDIDGVAAAEQIRQRLDIPVVFLTAHSDERTISRAKFSDPFGYIVKPFEEHNLQVAIELAPHRYEMERKLRQISRWMTATLASIGDGVIATNTKGEVLLINPVAEGLTGWSQAEVTGKSIDEILRLIQQETGEPVPNPVWSVLRHGKSLRLQENTLMVTRGGEHIHIDDCAAPIIDENETLLGVVLVFRDIADRKHSVERMRQLNKQDSRPAEE